LEGRTGTTAAGGSEVDGGNKLLKEKKVACYVCRCDMPLPS